MDTGHDYDRVGLDGFNAFHRAIWGNTPGHTDTVRVFLEAGAPPNKPTLAAKYGAQTQEAWVHPLQMIERNDATRELLEAWGATLPETGDS